MKFKTEKQILSLISNKVEESISLEYKQSKALLNDHMKTEISKDVSAFANSVGGTLVYGVKESGNIPLGIDNGVDPKEITKERIENIIGSSIAPKIDGIEILPIELRKSSPGRYIYVINIPQSTRAPHQASDKKYYKRHNFKSEPMEDYEIKDIANRRSSIRPIILVDTFTRSSVIYLSIKNIGADFAVDVKLTFDKELYFGIGAKRKIEDVPIFARGIKFFPPGKEFIFWYGSFPEIVSESSKKPSTFRIKTTYKKLNDPFTEYSDEFHLDMNDYYYTTGKSTLIEDELKNIRESINKLMNELSGKMKSLSYLENLTSPTGLDLSITTLRNLKSLLNREPFEKIDARYASYDLFREVLGVDIETAANIEDWIRYDIESDPMQKYSLSPELINELKKYFKLPKDI